MGVYAGERIFTSDPVHISDEDVSPRSFFLPDEAVLFTESYVYADIVTMNSADDTVAKVWGLHHNLKFLLFCTICV